MTKARTNANISPAVGRNRVINGSMNVAQRATSVTGIGAAAGYFTCDRWDTYVEATAGRLTASQTADGPNGISANCLKFDCTTADASIAAAESLILRHKFEGQNLQSVGKGVVGAKQITVSFYVKASATFTFACNLHDIDNNRHITKLFAVTTDWNRIELTFPADVDDGSSPFDDDNANSLALQFWLHAGTTYTGGTLQTTWANYVANTTCAGISSFFSNTANNFFITGVQMEVGPVATEFEQEEITTTLTKCQRYYQKLTGSYAQYGQIANVSYNTATQAQSAIVYPTEMRAAPTLSYTSTSSNNSNSAYAIANGSSNSGGVDYIDTLVLYNANAKSTLLYTGNSASGTVREAGNLYVQSAITELALVAEL